jgi:hypothetical protein
MPTEIITSRMLRAGGDSTRHIELGTRAGRFIRLRPGAYVTADEWTRAEPVDRHHMAIDALLRTANRPPVFSHASAALLHGIPVLGGWPEVAHIVESELRAGSRRSPRDVVVHRPRHHLDVRSIDGVMVTSPIATALDLAATRSLLAGVAAMDHVLATGTERHEFEQMILEWQPFHGAGKTRKALLHATGLAETPLESISLVGMRLGRLPEPVQQVEVVARGCTYRLDFLWPDLGVAGEADGRIKYLSGLDLLEEKRREDDIRSLGLGFARWDWNDAWAQTPMLARLADAGVRPAPRRASYSA